MVILDRYLAKQVIFSILMVSIALLGFDLFFSLVHELKVVGRSQYTLTAALSYLLLTIPSRMYAMFPWSALIGTLISLGALANHSELVVMRTASFSVGRITWGVVKAALLLLIVVVLVGEGIAPITERIAQSKRTWALSGGQTIQTPYGIWVRQGKEFIHIQSVRTDGELIGVTCYQFDHQRHLKKAFFAESANQNNGQWQLNGVVGTEFSAEKTLPFHKETMHLAQVLEPDILEAAMVRHPERLSLPILWRTIQHRTKNELNTQSYEGAFWVKICQPIVIIMMVFIAVPFVFGPLRSVSMGFRVVAGILVSFVFHTLNTFLTPLAIVYQLPPILAVLLPIFLFTSIGFILLKRAR